MTRPADQDSSRAKILRRIREALPGKGGDVSRSYRSIVRSYNREGALSREDCLSLFVDRLLDYGAEVVHVDHEAGIAGAVEETLRAHKEGRLLSAEAFPFSWMPTSVEMVRDTSLTKADLAMEGAVITTCEAAVASTGTIFLVHQGAQGRRIITLLPDHHICLVRRDQVYESLSQALAVIAPNAKTPLTMISGPSATSDIEMTRVRGVHGPRRLSVILYGALELPQDDSAAFDAYA